MVITRSRWKNCGRFIRHLEIARCGDSYTERKRDFSDGRKRLARHWGGELKDAIEKKFGFRPQCDSANTGELREAIGKNPFAKRKDIEPSKLAGDFS